MNPAGPALTERVRLRLRKRLGITRCEACGATRFKRSDVSNVTRAATEMDLSINTLRSFLAERAIGCAALDKIEAWLNAQV